eukprot:gb/GECG01015842.1/.p1 GENE.gb/GECG01015842.1/~~gb/GECG01015842.1/.p1  ORF type:complete len:539 (+),score=50.29 gb/GECG01015842.1/:1-1617(+)
MLPRAVLLCPVLSLLLTQWAVGTQNAPYAVVEHDKSHFSTASQPSKRNLRATLGADGNKYVSASVFGSTARGYYYSFVEVGTPPQEATVVLDTGSTLTAFPCKNCDECGKHMNPRFDPAASSTSKLYHCSSGGGCPQIARSCSKQGKCYYEEGYMEGSKIKGYLYSDILWIGRGTRNKNSSVRFDFGCHIYESKMFKTQFADGIMGLTKQPITLPYTLRDAGVTSNLLFSLCLSRRGGQLNIGATNRTMLASDLVTTPLKGYSAFHVVEVREMSLSNSDGTWTSLDVDMFRFNGGRGTIVDSGTTFTYLPTEAATTIFKEAERSCRSAGKHQCGSTFFSEEIGEKTLCIEIPSNKDKGHYNTQTPPEYLDDILPTVEFAFLEASLTAPPSQYLFSYYAPEASNWGDAWCVGFFGFDNNGAILGANVMQDYAFQFDMEKEELSFARANCEEISSCKRCDAYLNNHKSGGLVGRFIAAIRAHATAIAAALFVLSGALLVAIAYKYRQRRHLFNHQRLEDDDQHQPVSTNDAASGSHRSTM